MTAATSFLPRMPGAPEVADFDPDSRMQGQSRQALMLMAVLVFGLGLAAALVPIGGAVIGPGELSVESHVKAIAHPLGGTIAEIRVRNGQHVRKGDVLIRLDDRVSATEAQLSALTVDQLLAQKARLEAEQLGAGDIRFPDLLARRSDAGARKAMDDERRMFAIRQAEHRGLIGQLDARIEQSRQQIAAYHVQIAALRKQSVLIAPELDGVRKLYDKQLVTINRLNQLERSATDLDGQVGAMNARIAQTEAAIAEAREQIIQLAQTRRSEAGTQLAAVNAQLNQQQMRSVSAMDAQDRTLIRAPYGGVIDKLAFQTVGGVIRPAETIMEIVPDRDRLIVEASVSPSDIDQVRVGQEVRVRLSALSATVTPELRGRLIYVGADRATDSNAKISYFPVRIALDPADLADAGKRDLRPGMPAEVFIQTGERTMLSYLTRPLRDQFARAFRDN